MPHKSQQYVRPRPAAGRHPNCHRTALTCAQSRPCSAMPASSVTTARYTRMPQEAKLNSALINALVDQLQVNWVTQLPPWRRSCAIIRATCSTTLTSVCDRSIMRPFSRYSPFMRGTVERSAINARPVSTAPTVSGWSGNDGSCYPWTISW